MTTPTATNDSTESSQRDRRERDTRSASLPVNRILIGDATKRLQQLPAESIDTVVTSPPYFLLRDYGVDGQIGLEASIDAWVDQLAAVMGEVARVLKPSGSVWLNLGDTYSRHPRHGAPPKSLVLGPERLLLRLLGDGWSVRNKVVWAKPNPMPSSVKDRLSCTWEPMYLLTRERHYFFDLDGIRKPTTPTRTSTTRPSMTGQKYATQPGERPDWSGPLAGNNSGLAAMKAAGRNSHPLGKNPGDVWTIPTAAYTGAHFATFPQRLVEQPLLATCPERVCATCGLPWQRSTHQQLGSVAVRGRLRKSCRCSSRDWQPGVVLDPFIGSGTVAVTAERLRRRWLGIELNAGYAALAEQRIHTARYSGQNTKEQNGGGSAT